MTAHDPAAQPEGPTCCGKPMYLCTHPHTDDEGDRWHCSAGCYRSRPAAQPAPPVRDGEAQPEVCPDDGQTREWHLIIDHSGRTNGEFIGCRFAQPAATTPGSALSDQPESLAWVLARRHKCLDHSGPNSGPCRTDRDREALILASDWLAARDASQRREGAREALNEFANSRGVNIGDGDDEWWRGYRQAQRECAHDAKAAADRASALGGGSDE